MQTVTDFEEVWNSMEKGRYLGVLNLSSKRVGLKGEDATCLSGEHTLIRSAEPVSYYERIRCRFVVSLVKGRMCESCRIGSRM
jgi:hypothetical protein